MNSRDPEQPTLVEMKNSTVESPGAEPQQRDGLPQAWKEAEGPTGKGGRWQQETRRSPSRSKASGMRRGQTHQPDKEGECEGFLASFLPFFLFWAVPAH